MYTAYCQHSGSHSRTHISNTMSASEALIVLLMCITYTVAKAAVAVRQYACVSRAAGRWFCFVNLTQLQQICYSNNQTRCQSLRQYQHWRSTCCSFQVFFCSTSPIMKHKDVALSCEASTAVAASNLSPDKDLDNENLGCCCVCRLEQGSWEQLAWKLTPVSTLVIATLRVA